MATTQTIPPIAQGYAYALRVRVAGDEPVFPAGCTLRADLRETASSPKAAGSLSTADGSIGRVDDQTVDVHFTGEMTAAIGNDSAVLDFVRMDLSPPTWVGVQIRLPVIDPVTAP